MKKKLLLILFIVFSSLIYANQINLLEEYRLLYIDLSNVETWGYKSFFNPQYNRATENINISQGSLMFTGRNTDFAINGEGFFRIRLENDKIGYTRAGNFMINCNGDLVTIQGYFLYDNINFHEGFLPETLKVTGDGIVTVTIATIIEGRNIFTKKEVGRLLTYHILPELLIHYKGSIYLINDYYEFNGGIAANNKILQGVLEMSNFSLLAVILRMYYILSVVDENMISNRDLRKELLRIKINRLANQNCLLERALFMLNNKIEDIIRILDKEIETGILGQRNRFSGRHFIFPDIVYHTYLNRRLYFLRHILPYLRYDY